MSSRKFQICYLPLFELDLKETLMYIKINLKNSLSAHRLLDEVEAAIINRLQNLTSFEQYSSVREREYPYYRIYIRNYAVYYVVIDDVMEVRRFLYSARNLNELL